MGRIDAVFNNPKEVILRATEEAKDPLDQMDGEASAIRPVCEGDRGFRKKERGHSELARVSWTPG